MKTYIPNREGGKQNMQKDIQQREKIIFYEVSNKSTQREDDGYILQKYETIE